MHKAQLKCITASNKQSFRRDQNCVWCTREETGRSMLATASYTLKHRDWGYYFTAGNNTSPLPGYQDSCTRILLSKYPYYRYIHQVLFSDGVFKARIVESVIEATKRALACVYVGATPLSHHILERALHLPYFADRRK